MDSKKGLHQNYNRIKVKQISTDNIKIISINDRGKIPKKAYVLNIRKTNAIIQDKRLKRNYNDTFAQNKAKILSITFNHNIIFIKNVNL